MNVLVSSRRRRGFAVLVLTIGGILGFAQSGSGSGYVVSGLWYAEFYYKDTGEEYGSGYATLTQDASGNVSVIEDDPVHDFSFRRLEGSKIRYRLTITGTGGGPCASYLSGRAVLNTNTEIIVANITGILDDCSTTALVVTITKL